MTAEPCRSFLRQHADGCTLAIRVQPGAKKTSITGVYGDGDQAALKVAVHAPPIDGRANQALVEFLATSLRIPRTSVQLIAGQASRSKRFLLKGLSATDCETALLQAAPLDNQLTGTE